MDEAMSTTPAAENGESAAKHARAAAEAVRALNHATLPGTWHVRAASEVSEVLGEMESLSQRLTQTVAQLADWVQRRPDGLILDGAHTLDYSNIEDALDTVLVGLGEVEDHTVRLHISLSGVAQIMGHVAGPVE